MKTNIEKILLTGEDRPDLYSVHRLVDVTPAVKPQIVAEFHGKPINYPVDGGFEECDTTLMPEQVWEFEYVNRKNNFTSYFNDRTDPDNPTLASFEIVNSQGVSRWINYKMYGVVNPSIGVPNGNMITYSEVFPNIDLQYIVDTWRLKEDIIIKQPVEHYGYKFTLKLDPNIIMEPQEDGSIDFVDAETSERLWGIAKPYAKDAEEKKTWGVRYIIGKELYNGVEYDSIEVVIEDAEFIENAVFPIVIDPTTNIAVSASARDGTIYRSGSSVYPPNTTTQLLLNDTLVTPQKWKAATTYQVYVGEFIFDTSTLPDVIKVLSAKLRVKIGENKGYLDGRSVVADWRTNSTITTSEYTADVGNNAIAGVLMADILTSSVYDFNLINADANIIRTGYTTLRVGISGGIPSYANYIQIHAYESSDPQKPTLIVSYNVAPATPILTAPNGGETYNESATVTWEESADSDGDSLTYHLQYSPNNGADWYDIASGVSGDSYVWDTSELPAGSTYLVRIRAYDGYSYSGYDQSDGAFTIQHITDQVNVGGIWKEVDKRYCNISGVWKEIDTIYANINGTWKSS